METASNSTNIWRFIIGFFLLLPFCGVASYIQLAPAINTLQRSTENFDLLSDTTESIGTENYRRISEDSRTAEVTAFTSRMLGSRLSIMSIIPLVVGVLIGIQGAVGRNINRVLLSLLAVFISPLALGFIWSFMVSLRLPPDIQSPLSQEMIRDNFGLAQPETAANTVILVDSLVWALIAAVIGGALFIAVLRGRDQGTTALGKSIVAVWLILLAFTAISLAETFLLPFMITNGGPLFSTTSFSLHLYRMGFIQFNFGYGSAFSSILLIVTALAATFIWLILTLSGLRLSYEPAPLNLKNSYLASLISLPLLLLGLGVVGCMMLWTLSLANNQEGFSAALDAFDWGSAFMNTVAPAWLAIWLVQIPITYLAGMSLGFLRPLGRIGSALLFLPLLIIALLPTEGLVFDWYINARENGLINQTFPTLMFPYLVGGLSLLAFKLFFDGASDKYRAALAIGQSRQEAFIQKVFLPSLPIVLLMGIVLSFMSTQSLFWPLIVIHDVDKYNIPTYILYLRGAFSVSYNVLGGAIIIYVGLMAAIFLPLFILLQVFVVDRLAILSSDKTTAPIVDSSAESNLSN